MKNSKLAIYLGNFNRPENNAPGKRVYGNALILSELGYRVILIGKEKDPSRQSYPIDYGDNIFYYSFPVFGYKTSGYMAFLQTIIKKEGEPELIIRYGSPGLALFDGALLTFCRRNKICLIADVVDWLPSGGGNPVFNLIKGFDTYLEKAVFNCKSDGVIAISSYLSDYYAAKGCKTVVIPPLVRQYRKNESVNETVNIVYAGVPFRLGRKVKDASEVKDRLDLSVEAIAKADANNAVLNIYGITKEQYLTAYPDHQDLLDRSSGKILFHGRKNMAEIQDAVNRADFTILLRDRNRATMAGFPTKVVESLSCGTPVITTDTSDISKYVSEGVNGFFVDMSDPDTLAKQIERIISSDLHLRSQMKKACHASGFFVYINHIDSMKKFLEKAAE